MTKPFKVLSYLGLAAIVVQLLYNFTMRYNHYRSKRNEALLYVQSSACDTFNSYTHYTSDCEDAKNTIAMYVILAAAKDCLQLYLPHETFEYVIRNLKTFVSDIGFLMTAMLLFSLLLLVLILRVYFSARNLNHSYLPKPVSVSSYIPNFEYGNFAQNQKAAILYTSKKNE